ncbi:MAG TPA: DUF4331 domain-containing protein [Aquabacterium sp.]|nr:DUF4331 domain-containing protein [Aquabacterium sp.]HQC97485.1 DUF4331 domain-containing protein [Aquabacterium sp.]
MRSIRRAGLVLAAIPLSLTVMLSAQASSHREAPFITTAPKVDGTDFYMFRSYETGRSDYVTLIANYLPLQDAYGGPNYFALDPNALYEIHIDNNGDAKEDISFQFRFRNMLNNGGISLPIGDKMQNIPLIQAGTVTDVNSASLQYRQTFGVTVMRGDRRAGRATAATNASGGTSFDKPVDNIGVKTIPDYAGYAAKHVQVINIPGCSQPGRVFVGQRQDPFAVNLGTVFDLVNAPASVLLNPDLKGAAPNTIGDKNVTTIALEVHKSCLTQGSEPVIGGWTTASLRQARLLDGTPPSGLQASEKVGGAWVQVSRLGMPLVNEVVIGLKDKDRFNASKPVNDAQFADYVTHPTLPALVGVALAGNPAALAPTNLPRTDLVAAFLTGIGGVNKPAQGVAAELLRLNTAIAPVPFAQQNRLGVVGNLLAGGNDNAGFPNGRRPKDDVVDIALVAAMGGLCVANGDTNALGLGAACKPSAVPLGAQVFALHDAVDQAVVPLLPGFPYLNTPLPGSR